MTDDTEDGYPVGYRKPPRHTRFKAGKSGNPKGRPKGAAKSPFDQIVQELEAKVEVTENGKRQKMTKLEAIVKRLVNTALVGDKKSMEMVVKVFSILEQQPVVTEGKTMSRVQFTWLPPQPPVKGEENITKE